MSSRNILSLICIAVVLLLLVLGEAASLSVNSTTFNRSAVSYRIVNGVRAKMEDNRHLVSLHERGVYYCAGALVSMWDVVTAAHCLHKVLKKDMIVAAGIINLQAQAQRRHVQNTFYPKTLTGGIKESMDIGVIKVDKAFVPGQTVATIALCDCRLTPGTTKLRVSGWGSLREGSKQTVNNLRTAEMPILEMKTCLSKYKGTRIKVYANTMVCVDNRERGICDADSGAPGVVDGKLCTVASFSVGCAQAAHPDVHTDINNKDVRAFINQHISKK